MFILCNSINLTEGCNHMKCTCGQAFCWLCGKPIEDTIFPAHFQWWNPSGCSNLQMHNSVEPSAFSRTAAKVFTCVELILLGPLTFLSTLLSLLLCSCCIPYMIKSAGNDSTLKGKYFTRITNLASHW